LPDLEEMYHVIVYVFTDNLKAKNQHIDEKLFLPLLVSLLLWKSITIVENSLLINLYKGCAFSKQGLKLNCYFENMNKHYKIFTLTPKYFSPPLQAFQIKSI
jgi:hypothetical protein